MLPIRQSHAPCRTACSGGAAPGPRRFWRVICALGGIAAPLFLSPAFCAADPPPAALQADAILRVAERVEPSVVSILRVRLPSKLSPLSSTDPTLPQSKSLESP